MESTERNRFAYYKKKKGGIIKEVERYHEKFQVIKEVDFVLLRVLEEGDNRYLLWAGNAKTIPYSFFFPGTPEGLQEAEKKFNEFYEGDMRVFSDNLEREYVRIGRKKENRVPRLKRMENRQNKLRGEIADMIVKKQIDLKTINRIYDEELQKIENIKKTTETQN